MWLLLDNNDDITSLRTWELISLAVEVVGLPIGCTFVNISINNLLFLDDFFTKASLASILLINNLALSIAGVARLSGLGVVAWSELLHLGDHTTALAGGALSDSTVLATLAFTLDADTLAVDSNLGLLSIVDILEGHLQWVLERLHFLGASFLLLTSTATHEHVENVVHALTATAATFLKTFLSVFVVNGALLLVSEDFVGLLKLLECLGIATTIGMVLESRLSEGFLNLVCSCILCDSKSFVVLCVVDLFRWATLWHLTTTHTAEGKSSAAAAAEKHVFKLI